MKCQNLFLWENLEKYFKMSSAEQTISKFALFFLFYFYFGEKIGVDILC